MHLTDLELSRCTGGAWRSSEAARGFVARTVCTDTRQLREGDLFVALKGENGDGHDYLDRAVEGGAGALVIHRADAAASVPESLPVLIVPDTLRGLGDIAMAWRAKCPAHRTAIVGSAGKTTTKDMLAMLLRHALVEEGKGETLPMKDPLAVPRSGRRSWTWGRSRSCRWCAESLKASSTNCRPTTGESS